jgi:phosphonate transport system permease protein
MSDLKNSQSSPLLAGLFSIILPGAGQAYAGERSRGFWLLVAFLVSVGTIAWYGEPVWGFAPIFIWLWSSADAASLAKRERSYPAWIPVLVGMIAAIGIGWDVVQIDLKQADSSRALAIIRPMLHPDFVEPSTELREGWVPIQMPCTADAPPAQRSFENGIRMTSLQNCGRIGDLLIVSGQGFWNDVEVQVWWNTPIGDSIPVGEDGKSVLIAKPDEDGNVLATIRIPATANISAGSEARIEEHRVYFQQYREIGGMKLSENGGFVFKGITETLALALMATTFSMLLAIPISFLAARNLMSGNPITLGIYVVVRTILNVVRSIESLIIAIIFVVIVGLGPFAGVIAITIHSIAALGKLYSEVIEGIDPGPIEAIRATGATWAQVVRYGVVPQIVPPFTAFTIYRWDINVRSSTIIGMVGGGGIGFYLVQWIQINELRAVSASFIAIAVVVVALDYVSAKVRERLI